MDLSEKAPKAAIPYIAIGAPHHMAYLLAAFATCAGSYPARIAHAALCGTAAMHVARYLNCPSKLFSRLCRTAT